MTEAQFDWEDPLRLDDQLTEDERMVQDMVRRFAEDRLMPVIVDCPKTPKPREGCLRRFSAEK